MDWSQVVSALAFIAVALAVGGGMLAASHILPWWLGAYRRKGPKLQPYECGVPRFQTSQRHFSVKFYLMALMLALFDIESVFLIVFAVNYKEFLSVSREYSFAVLMEMLVFLSVLGFGLYYIIRRGVLDFNETNSSENAAPAANAVTPAATHTAAAPGLKREEPAHA